MPRCETTRDQYGTGSSFIDFDREQCFCRPATPDQRCCSFRHRRHGCSWRREKCRGRSLYDKSPPWEEIMKKRLVAPLVGLAISFALPTYAQQKDLADPQTTQKILALGKAALEAHNNHDAAAVAAGYTRDAVFLTPDRPIGRQAIQKWFTDLFQSVHPKNCMAKVDGNAFHLIGPINSQRGPARRS
jgi:hypothetical protein